MAGLSDFARDAYDLYFQVSPITLTGGILSQRWEALGGWRRACCPALSMVAL